MKKRNDNINQYLTNLYYFHIVMKRGQTAAAKELMITQPAIRQSLVRLENYFGFKLYKPSKGRGNISEPTEEGKQVLAHCKKIFSYSFMLSMKTEELRAMQPEEVASAIA
jgi:DNA-binding transcriptional LysR family regulator